MTALVQASNVLVVFSQKRVGMASSLRAKRKQPNRASACVAKLSKMGANEAASDLISSNAECIDVNASLRDSLHDHCCTACLPLGTVWAALNACSSCGLHSGSPTSINLCPVLARLAACVEIGWFSTCLREEV